MFFFLPIILFYNSFVLRRCAYYSVNTLIIMVVSNQWIGLRTGLLDSGVAMTKAGGEI